MGQKKLKAALTIEMSFLIPIVLVIFMELIMTIFYYHDKNILNGAAYETSVVGSASMRKKEKLTDSDLEVFCRDRMKGKCIFLTFQEVDVTIDEEEIRVEVSARKKGFSVSVEKQSFISRPEKKIRNLRR